MKNLFKQVFFVFVLSAFSAATVNAQTEAPKPVDVERCFSRVNIPDLTTLKEGEYSLYFGVWTSINLCQALLVKGKETQGKVKVVYIYEAGQYPAGSVNAEASFSDKKITFSLPWKNNPVLTYYLSDGRATYQDKTGIYPGNIVLRSGPGLAQFEVLSK